MTDPHRAAVVTDAELRDLAEASVCTLESPGRTVTMSALSSRKVALRAKRARLREERLERGEMTSRRI